MTTKQRTTTGADLRALAVADMTAAALVAAGAIAAAAERAGAAGQLSGAYCAMDDISPADAAASAGDELRAMSPAGLARALAGALAEGLEVEKVQRLNYYLQVSMGSDSMRTLAELAPEWRTEN